MRELSKFRKDLLALRLHGQLSFSKLSRLLNTVFIGKTEDKKNKCKNQENKKRGFLI